MYRISSVLAFILALSTPVLAQQPLPLTEWRAAVDADLAKLAMPRDAHASIFNIMQLYERQAQQEKFRASHAGPPPVPALPQQPVPQPATPAGPTHEAAPEPEPPK